MVISPLPLWNTFLIHSCVDFQIQFIDL
jgi:hypothetical protein